MIVEWIALDAFGAFRDRRIALAPGFNLVHGGNEAGKSTLHAALVTGLTGVRRARGRAREEMEFEERYRPWSGPGWKLRLVLKLGDGRHVEIVQDLDRKENCRAHDAVLGRDVTHEIASTDWTPDATRWLGIDRRAFVAMASVRQSELRAVREHAGALREFVQRAVATAGADGTAATAIERIDAFMREHVGVRTVHSTKPLRRAQQQVDTARLTYERARTDHDKFLQLLAQEEEHLARVSRAVQELQQTQAARALSIVAGRRQVVDRVRALQRLHPNGPPPERAAEDILARDVDRALQLWAQRPAAVALAGPSAAEMRREHSGAAGVTPSITPGVTPGATTNVAANVTAGFAPGVMPGAATGERSLTAWGMSARTGPAPLHGETAAPASAPAPAQATAPASAPAQATAPASAPAQATAPASAPAQATAPARAPTQTPAPAPRHDSEPVAEIRAAAARFELARDTVRAHARTRPEVTSAPPGGHVTLNELQRLSERLGSDEPVIDIALERRSASLDIDVADARRATRWARVAAFTLLAIAIVGGAIVAGAGRWPWLAGPAVLGAAALIAFAVGTRRARVQRRLEGEWQQTQDERRRVDSRHEAWERDCEEARERALELQLPPDAAILQRLAEQREHWESNRYRLAGWETAHTQLVRDFERLEDQLRVLLRDHGVAAGTDLTSDVAAYEAACRARAQQHDLEARIERRIREEAVARHAETQRAAASAAVTDVARRCQLDVQHPEHAIAPLQAWLEGRGRVLEAADRAQQEWAQLETLRAGRSLFELENELAQAEARAAELSRGLDASALGAAPRGEDDVLRRQRALHDAEHQLGLLRAEIERNRTAATPLADAEDECRAAELELQRVEALEATLRTAQRFLVQAQERVHRDVAPLLANAVRTALPHITGGRWVDARVDPETMDVMVQDPAGNWRRAALLSHGTAEQVYLLLRTALVRHLVRRGESCPLFLDDATVQFDRERKRAALDTLYILSRDRQIVVFTQEDSVFEWARTRLTPSTDAIIPLSPAHA